jgi:hypothetical protein
VPQVSVGQVVTWFALTLGRRLFAAVTRPGWELTWLRSECPPGAGQRRWSRRAQASPRSRSGSSTARSPAMAAFRDHGLGIAQDVSIAGFDEIKILRDLVPALDHGPPGARGDGRAGCAAAASATLTSRWTSGSQIQYDWDRTCSAFRARHPSGSRGQTQTNPSTCAVSTSGASSVPSVIQKNNVVDSRVAGGGKRTVP